MSALGSFEFQGTKRFAILSRLGAGGMGVVYEALDRELDTRVALKTLRHVDAQSLYRLKNEFRALQDIEHPNLVSLGELIEDSGVWFFTMELVLGTGFLEYVRSDRLQTRAFASTARATFDDLLEQKAPAAALDAGSSAVCFDEDRLRPALGQLAQAVAAVHRAGMVHRDVKPSNVRVTPEGRVVLLDFGLVTDAALSEQSSDPHIVGTVAYMAPEQAITGHVQPEADWYAFGVVLYEALTGRLPYEGKTPFDIIGKKQQHAPAPPRARVPKVPRDLDDLCVSLLSIEPEDRPSASDVLARLGVADQPQVAVGVTTSSAHTQSSPFIGREQELEVLRGAFDDSSGGKATTVYIQGESGLGKSTLMREFTDKLQGETGSAVVLAGRCYERESVPYKAFDGVVDALSRYLRGLSDADASALMPRHAALLPRVFPVLGRVEVIVQSPLPTHQVRDPHELRHRVFGALRELLGRICDRNPLVLVIDDLQWSDADSLVLLSDIMRPPDAPALLLLLASRDESTATSGKETMGAAASKLLHSREAKVKWMRLLPLAPEVARRLAAVLLERTSVTDTVDPATIAKEARGHPLYIDELVRHAEMTGGVGGQLLLDEAIWQRTLQLPPAAQHILELVVVAGSPLPQGILCDAAKVNASDFTKQVSLLRVANTVRISGGRSADTIESYHDRVREAVLAHMEPDTRVKRHARLAVALETAGAANEHPALLLRHLEAAGQLERAAVCAEGAANRASEALAFDRAVALYRTALRLGSYQDDVLRALRIRLAGVLANAGRGAEAADVYLVAAEGADLALRRACKTHATKQLLITGHIERGLDTTRALLIEVGAALSTTPRRALMALLWQRFRVRLRGWRYKERHEAEIANSDLARQEVFQIVGEGLSMVDNIQGLQFLARGARLALELGEPKRVARAMGGEVMFIASQGPRGTARVKKLLARMRQIAKQVRDPHLSASALFAEGCASYLSGRFEHATECLTEAETGIRDLTVGSTFELNNTRLFLLFSLRHAGAYPEWLRAFDRCVHDAERRGDLYAETSMRRGNSLLWLVQGRPGEARRQLERTAWSPPESGYHLQHLYELGAGAEIALYEGRFSEFFEERGLRIQFGRSRFARSLLNRIQMVRALGRWSWGRGALAMVEVGSRRNEALREAASCARRLARERIGFASVWGLLLGAGVAFQQSNLDKTVDLLRDAISTAQSHSMEHLVATARYRLGELVDGDEGAALITQGTSWMQAAGVSDPARLVQVFAPGFTRPS